MRRLFLLVALCYCTPLAAQYSDYDLYMCPHDTLLRASWDISQPPKNLADTLRRVYPKCYYDKEFVDVPRAIGGLTMHFKAEDCMRWERWANYVFPLVLERPLGEGVRFEIDWVAAYPRENWEKGYPWSQYDPYEMWVRGDTLITSVSPCDAGGITPEYGRFRVCGERVKSIAVRTKCVLSVAQGIDVGGFDYWGVPLGKIETPWTNTAEDDFSYRLPEIKCVEIGLKEFEYFKRRAVGLQRRYLIEKRDSVIRSGYYGGAENASLALDGWQARLLPDFSAASTFSQMYVFVSMDYFLTEISVKMKDGHTKRYVHVATYSTNIP